VNGLADGTAPELTEESDWRIRRTICTTGAWVPRSLHVRLDDASAAAPEVVRAGQMTDSEAVRTALREAAARRRVRSALREEVRLPSSFGPTARTAQSIKAGDQRSWQSM
jgi:hypothetical protein